MLPRYAASPMWDLVTCRDGTNVAASRCILSNTTQSLAPACLKGTPWGLEYTFSRALFVTTRPIHILVFDTYMPRYICNCFRCSLIAFFASWSRSMCKFQQFPFEKTRSQGVPLKYPAHVLRINVRSVCRDGSLQSVEARRAV